MRGQAALFDGIMFLLISSMSVSIMYSAMVVYGESQDRVLRSAHVLNYMQSTMKSIYSTDVSTLDRVPDPHASAACAGLSRWTGSITVADLLKKDLADPVSSCSPGATPSPTNRCGAGGSGKLDDKYGSADAPGKTALWCLLNEVTEPFTQSGYKYLAEILNANLLQTYLSGNTVVITNSKVVQDGFQLFPRGQPLCEFVSEYYPEALTVSAPFRILVEEDGAPQTVQYVLRVCVWPSNESISV